jgi:hypothetical protein
MRQKSKRLQAAKWSEAKGDGGEEEMQEMEIQELFHEIDGSQSTPPVCLCACVPRSA